LKIPPQESVVVKWNYERVVQDQGISRKHENRLEKYGAII
jgi:hypothetical protein